jgi:hypothetical protein
MDNKETTLASELLREVKLSARRWFIAFCIMITLEIATIAGFMWYMSLPVDEVTIENDSENANYIGNDLNGDLNNGENSEETESSKTAQTETLNNGN